MAKVFPSLPLLLISGIALRCLKCKLEYNACFTYLSNKQNFVVLK